MDSPVVSVFSSFFLLCISSALSVSLWSLHWKWGGAEAQHNLVCLQRPCPACHPSSSSPSPLQNESRYDCLYWVEHYSWAMFSHWTSFQLVPRDTGPFIHVSSSQKFLILQQFGVLPCLPKPVEAEVEVQLNHLFALVCKWDRRSLNHTWWKQNIPYDIPRSQSFPNLNKSCECLNINIKTSVML